MGEELPTRKPVRLNGYDYSNAGYYFITICVKDGYELLWDILPVSSDTVVGAAFCRPPLSGIGKIVEYEIAILSRTYEDVTIDQYVVMPNHVHMIVRISDSGRQNAAPTVPRIIGQWKRTISMKIGFSLWQKSYHDRIIRDEAEYQRICQYIDENPARWEEDEYYD